MKLLWLCNMVPGAVQEMMGGNASGGLWVDHVLSDLRRQENMQIHILCLSATPMAGRLDESCGFETFQQVTPYKYLPELEETFLRRIQEFAPDVIHSWGVEFAHTLAMVNAAERTGMLDRMVVSIQGLCGYIAPHYTQGLPHNVIHGYTFRDFVRQDNIAWQQKKFLLRGNNERESLKKVGHVIGRTEWDFACTAQLHPGVNYHFCNETLRKPFYEGQWRYDGCQKHRIFAAGCGYPVKGFHYLLEAFAEVLKSCPDAILSVPGKNPEPQNRNERIRQNGYQRYLARRIRELGLQGKVEFLGGLTAEQMKENYLRANVFVLPSTIENSPNSLGEAMLLGVPCVASDVGGVTTMMTHMREGFVYQSTAPYMLAHYILKVFSLGEEASRLGEAARAHAMVTHDPGTNLEDLLKVYRLLAEKRGEKA